MMFFTSAEFIRRKWRQKEFYMFKILVSDPLAQEGVDILKKVKEFEVDVKHKLPPEELKKIIKDYDCLLVRSETKVTKDIIESADKLKVIGRAGVGLDNVDLQAASKRGIIEYAGREYYVYSRTYYGAFIGAF
jgi:phosphoglycerate dehydrogenase-like enzyme